MENMKSMQAVQLRTRVFGDKTELTNAFAILIRKDNEQKSARIWLSNDVCM